MTTPEKTAPYNVRRDGKRQGQMRRDEMNGTSANTVRLRGMEFFAYHGVMPEERALGQRFMVDADLMLSYKGVFDRDDLLLTVNYALVYESIAAVMTQTYQTIEYLAEQIARELLTEFACSEVRVVVHKPGAPVPGVLSDVAVDIVRPNVWQVFLGLGSNRGDRAAYLKEALDGLRRLGVFRKLSHVYETEPLGIVGEKMSFFNMVVEMETALPPGNLLRECLRIEALCGRRRDPVSSEASFERVSDDRKTPDPGTSDPDKPDLDIGDAKRWSPRTLDIDLLMLFRGPGRKQEVIRTAELVVPHPRMEQREFVLAPLREIAPHMVLPSGGQVGQVVGEGKVGRLSEELFSEVNF